MKPTIRPTLEVQKTNRFSIAVDDVLYLPDVMIVWVLPGSPLPFKLGINRWPFYNTFQRNASLFLNLLLRLDFPEDPCLSAFMQAVAPA